MSLQDRVKKKVKEHGLEVLSIKSTTLGSSPPTSVDDIEPFDWCNRFFG